MNQIFESSKEDLIWEGEDRCGLCIKHLKLTSRYQWCQISRSLFEFDKMSVPSSLRHLLDVISPPYSEKDSELDVRVVFPNRMHSLSEKMR